MQDIYSKIGNNMGPVRKKKGPSLVSSVMGVLIGIVLLIASPLVMWQAENQHAAKDFAKADRVAADSGASGFITFSGVATYADENGGEDCLVEDCIYQTEAQQILTVTDDVLCSENVKRSEELNVLDRNGSECDENGDCVPCYDVQKIEWKTTETISSLYDVNVGSYLVRPNEGAIYFDIESQTVETIEGELVDPFDLVDERYIEYLEYPEQSVYSYFLNPDEILVAGQSDGKQVVGADKKAYVFSQYGEEITAAKLVERDEQNRLMFRIITFILLFLGFALVLGPLHWIGRQARYIPVIGKMLSKGSGALVTGISLILAVIFWIILWILVTVLKLWWLALIAMILIVGFVYWRSKQE